MVLRLDSNLGYGRAVNAGAELWPRHHVLALNVDTVVAPGALGRLAGTLASDEQVALVAPRLLEADGSLQRSAYEFPSLTGFARQALGLKRTIRATRYPSREESAQQAFEVDWASGAALLIRREPWDAVGGFDPSYRFFVEEVDLQRRLRDAGWSVMLDPRAEITHFGGAHPIPAARFALAHDGWERYFGSRYGRRRQVAARALLCAVAASRCALWLALAVLRPAGRRESLLWARMFAAVTLLSAAKLPAASLRRHSPYAP
jgi:N-acetylglucosaminyl-diphospho-decaprenol L-rhamnosyltransferase